MIIIIIIIIIIVNLLLDLDLLDVFQEPNVLFALYQTSGSIPQQRHGITQHTASGC